MHCCCLELKRYATSEGLRSFLRPAPILDHKPHPVDLAVIRRNLVPEQIDFSPALFASGCRPRPFGRTPKIPSAKLRKFGSDYAAKPHFTQKFHRPTSARNVLLPDSLADGGGRPPVLLVGLCRNFHAAAAAAALRGARPPAGAGGRVQAGAEEHEALQVLPRHRLPGQGPLRLGQGRVWLVAFVTMAGGRPCQRTCNNFEIYRQGDSLTWMISIPCWPELSRNWSNTQFYEIP